jgi:hypothetical protein
LAIIIAHDGSTSSSDLHSSGIIGSAGLGASCGTVALKSKSHLDGKLTTSKVCVIDAVQYKAQALVRPSSVSAKPNTLGYAFSGSRMDNVPVRRIDVHRKLVLDLPLSASEEGKPKQPTTPSHSCLT